MLIAFLRASICGGEIDETIKKNLTEENLIELYKLAKKHDLAHIVADVLYKKKLMPDCQISIEYKNYLIMALIRYQQITYELTRICNLLEKNKIPHIPLKGAVIRQYYPEPWLRTSCDIDILIKPENMEHTENLFVNVLEYTKDKCGHHDISFYSNAGVHIELHFKLIETDNKKIGKSRRWNACDLENIWNVSVPVINKKYHYSMPDELFYLYHVAHMANHVEEGGCGIRVFLDLWILDNLIEGDYEKRMEKIESANLVKFFCAAQAVAKSWFDGEEYDENGKMLENFVLESGIYGNFESRILSYTKIKGGKFKYFKYRIFPPYDSIKYQFPVIKKHKWLLPVCYIIRIFDFLFVKKQRKPTVEYSISKKISEEKYESVAKLFDDLGLV